MNGCQRTSHTDWDIEQVLGTYWRITDIDASFRSLKSELGLRPIHHQLDRRIAAHLMIAVFAYCAVQLIRTRPKRTDDTLIVNRQNPHPAAEVAEMALVEGVTSALHRERIGIPS